MQILTKPTFLVPLSGISASDDFGAKAFRLAEMSRLGYPVPNGLVISGRLFSQTIGETHLHAFIESRIQNLSLKNITAVADAAAAIETELRSVALPAEFIEQLRTATAPLLEAGPVVVRSSACGEDSAEAAFAGQLDSFLNIRTLEELIRAIPRCWASYWSHRSLAYQLARKVQLQSMGVIIQQQVQAKISGVLFSRNLRNPHLDEVVVEYCSGLGERLVSGEICPSRITIDSDGSVNKETDDVSDISRQDATQTFADRGDDLLKESIAQLASAARSLERAFGHPQDVEWCIDQSDRLHIVQSRPITTIRKMTPKVVWSNANVNENFPEPISPLLYSIATVGYYNYFRNLAIAFGISMERISAMEFPLRNIIGTHAGRMYYNLTNIHGVLRAAPLGEFLAESFNQFVGSEATDRSQQTPNWKSSRRNWLAERLELMRIARKAFVRFRKMESRVAVFESTVDDFAKDSHLSQLQSADSRQLLSLWRRFIAIRSNWTDAAMADASSMIYYQLTQKFLASEFAEDADRTIVNRLLTGLCDIVSGLPVERLWELSRSIRRHQVLVDAFENDTPQDVWHRIQTDDSVKEVRDELHQFLEQWGFRCSGELMLTKPSYQDDPASLMPILATFVTRESPSPREHLEQQQQLRETITQGVLNRLRSRKVLRFLPWPRKDFFARWLLHSTQRSVACRERARLKQAMLYSRLRHVALAIGRLLTKQELLEQHDDIFYLTFQETEDILCGVFMLPNTIRDLARLRRSELLAAEKLNPPDRIELAEGEFWQPVAISTKASEGDLANPDVRAWNQGTGVSGGTMTGRAVVLTSPDQFAEVAQGDILVTRQTDPGWGPILFLVSGLVMERGGMLSHGAILAREYGIPTVVGIQGATQRIVSGDTIRVDGDRGLVEILS